VKKNIDPRKGSAFWTFSKNSFAFEKGAVLAFSLFMLVYLFVTFIQLKSHTAPPMWDDSWYLTNSEIAFKALKGNDTFSRMYYGLRNDNNFYLFTLFSRLMYGIRAPLIVLTPLLSYFIFGTGFPGLVVTFLLQIIIFGSIFYSLVLRQTDAWTAFLAAAITLTMPLAVGLSRIFYVEYILMILVTLWVFLQSESSNFLSWKHSLLLGVVLGLGMLTKVTFPVYILGPILWGLFSFLRAEKITGQRIARLVLNGLVILLIGTLIMSSWYFDNLKTILGYAASSSFGSISNDYSLGNILDIQTFLRYWTLVINLGISSYYFILLIIFSVIYGMKYLNSREEKDLNKTNTNTTTTPIFFLWFIVPFLIFSFGANKDYRFLLPTFPALGFLIARLITKTFPQKREQAIVIPLVLLFPCLLFLYTSLPLSSNYSLNAKTFTIISPDLGYDTRPVRQTWFQKQILTSIKKDARKNKIKIKKGLTIGVVPNYAYFNSLNFMYSAIHENLNYQFESFGPAADNEAWMQEKERLLMMDYLITKTGDQGPVFAHNPDITPLLLSGGLPFDEVARFQLPDGSEGIIYRKILPGSQTNQ
jgi:4-amino-4-deoxy-L-arabinose transferase-like glycosyltransferase